MNRKVAVKKIARIEGHLNVTVRFTGQDIEVRAEAIEGVRLLRRKLVGKDATEIPEITSRMCGVCHVIHKLTAIQALEKALGIEVSDDVYLFRRALAMAGLLQSHVIHLYFFVLPDQLEVRSILDLGANLPLLRRILRLKKLADKVVAILGGREVHVITPKIGGLSKDFTKREAMQALRVLQEFERILSQVLSETREVFQKVPELQVKLDYLALASDECEIPLLKGVVKSCMGITFSGEEYIKYISTIVEPYSSSRHFVLSHRTPYMVGSLARINVNRDTLPQDIVHELAEYGVKLPCNNPFFNNVAQLLELTYFLRELEELLDVFTVKPVKATSTEIRPREGEGVAITEAPRGLLIHHYKLSRDGKISDANIITPTAQNLKAIEQSIRALVREKMGEGLAPNAVEHEIEKLVRAFDPCMSCSSRFFYEGA